MTIITAPEAISKCSTSINELRLFTVCINTASRKSTPMIIEGPAHTMAGGHRVLGETVAGTFDSSGGHLSCHECAHAEENCKVLRDREMHSLHTKMRLTPAKGKSDRDSRFLKRYSLRAFLSLFLLWQGSLWLGGGYVFLLYPCSVLGCTSIELVLNHSGSTADMGCLIVVTYYERITSIVLLDFGTCGVFYIVWLLQDTPRMLGSNTLCFLCK